MLVQLKKEGPLYPMGPGEAMAPGLRGDEGRKTS